VEFVVSHPSRRNKREGWGTGICGLEGGGYAGFSTPFTLLRCSG
jgi:hypothetical protein